MDLSPKHARALGRLTAHWAYFESELESLLGILLRDHAGLSSVILRSFNGASTKIDLLVRVNKARNNPYQAQINETLQEAARLNSERDKHVHGLWQIEAESKGKLTRLSGHKKSAWYPNAKAFSAKEIQSDVEAIAELSLRLYDLEAELAAAFSKHQ